MKRNASIKEPNYTKWILWVAVSWVNTKTMLQNLYTEKNKNKRERNQPGTNLYKGNLIKSHPGDLTKKKLACSPASLRSSRNDWDHLVLMPGNSNRCWTVIADQCDCSNSRAKQQSNEAPLMFFRIEVKEMCSQKFVRLSTCKVWTWRNYSKWRLQGQGVWSLVGNVVDVSDLYFTSVVSILILYAVFC